MEERKSQKTTKWTMEKLQSLLRIIFLYGDSTGNRVTSFSPINLNPDRSEAGLQNYRFWSQRFHEEWKERDNENQLRSPNAIYLAIFRRPGEPLQCLTVLYS
jgi:hypothetical protein